MKFGLVELRKKSSMFFKIIIAYDGSEDTLFALQQAADLADQNGAELHVIGIVAPMSDANLAQQTPFKDFLSTERSHIEQALLNAMKEIGGRNIQVATTCREGNPAEQLAAYAREIDADLLVVGHKEKSFLERWLEGQTGGKLIHDLPCSLLVATNGSDR